MTCAQGEDSDITARSDLSFRCPPDEGLYPWLSKKCQAKTQISLSMHGGLIHYENTPIHITKTRLYNFDPLKPHFYIVKLGFTEKT